jgi:hypothetical protein
MAGELDKPKAIQWLEQQTGQRIDYAPEEQASRERHLSVRVTTEMLAVLEQMAAERSITVSQVVRELVASAVADREAVSALDARKLVERLAADVAEVRRRLAG